MESTKNAPGASIIMDMGWKLWGITLNPKNVPAPKSSLTPPIMVKAKVNPRPMPNPSKKEFTGPFLDA